MNLKQAVRSFYFYKSEANPNTAKFYRNFLESLPWQDEEIGSITFPMIQNFLSRFKSLSPATKNLRKAMLKSFFAWLVEAGHVPSNPTKLIRPEKALQREAKFLNQAAVKKFRQTIKGSTHELLFELYLMTGLRLSEALALNIGDVRNKRVITVIGKGKKQRQVFLTPSLAKLIKSSVNGDPPDAPLFVSHRGSRLTPAGVQSILAKYLRKAKIKGRYSPHSLRHTFATSVYQQTKDLRLTQELLGHSSPLTTARYAHVEYADKRKALNQLYT